MTNDIIILSMEQVAFTHPKTPGGTGASFARNIRRLVDGRNCLDTMFRFSKPFNKVYFYISIYIIQTIILYIFKFYRNGKLIIDYLQKINKYIFLDILLLLL